MLGAGITRGLGPCFWCLPFWPSIPLQAKLAKLAVANRRLLKENEEHRARELAACQISVDLLQIKLEEIAVDLDLKSSERVSFFVDSPERDGLVLATRHSITLSYKTSGRRRYPYLEGCLGTAWDEGGIDDCSIEANPLDNPDDWAREVEQKAKMPASTALALHMKSRTCIARRIPGPPGSTDHRGVIVVESTSAATDAFVGQIPKYLDPQRLETYILKNQRMLERLLELTSDLRAATRGR
jgi:hypothetical protein